jgi:bifunctional non-homologous end joining protein LigD
VNSPVELPSPQLATLSQGLPYGPEWRYEYKYDGYRILAVKEGPDVRLFTRNRLDWTDKFLPIKEGLNKMPDGTIIDGEIVALNAKNKISFSSLQQAFKGKPAKLKYYVFDILFLNNKDLRKLSFAERRILLEKSIKFNNDILLSPVFEEKKLETLLAKVEKEGLEGIMAKDISSTYQSKRTRTWLKYKIGRHEELVVCGYSPHSKRSGAIGALLLGLFAGGKELCYCGKVGTGFSEKERRELFQKMKPDKKTEKQILNKSDVPSKSVLCKPVLVCEVGFTEWTPDGLLRHPKFLGLRSDKSASEVLVRHSSHPYTKIKNTGKQHSL